MPGTFLTAEWRKLAMANYAVDPQLLHPHLPLKTEIDLWNGTCYVSLVGFVFLQTKIKGIAIPGHVNFEEVNLRFYVRYCDQGEWKRGVVFIKEIVPKAMLTLVANSVYGEHYETMPIQHEWLVDGSRLSVGYRWRKNGWHGLKIIAENRLRDISNGSEEEFITEHYWGYTKLERATSEYQVEHPRWQVYPTIDAEIDVDFGMVYGQDFAFLANEKPKSVFLAEGSAIKVNAGMKI